MTEVQGSGTEISAGDVDLAEQLIAPSGAPGERSWAEVGCSVELIQRMLATGVRSRLNRPR